MSDNGSDVGIIASIAAAIGSVLSVGTVIAIIRLSTQFSDRITIADQTAKDARQEAAEAKNEVADIRAMLDDRFRDLSDKVDRRTREEGEGLAALRQHVTEVAFFVRDNFVRQPEFASTMSEIKTGLNELNRKVDRLAEQRADR